MIRGSATGRWDMSRSGCRAIPTSARNWTFLVDTTLTSLRIILAAVVSGGRTAATEAAAQAGARARWIRIIPQREETARTEAMARMARREVRVQMRRPCKSALRSEQETIRYFRSRYLPRAARSSIWLIRREGP